MTAPPDRPEPAGAPRDAPHGAGVPAGPTPLPPVWSGSPPSGATPSDRGPSKAALFVAVMVLAVLVAAVAFVLLNARNGGSATASPGPSVATSEEPGTPSVGETLQPTPSGRPADGSPSAGASVQPSPTASIDTAKLEAEIARVEAQVPPIRGLQPTEPVPNRFLDQAALKAELERSFRKENPTELVAAQQALYQHLGLLPADADLESLILELLGSAVAGFYDPETGRMTIRLRATELGPLERTALAHEYTHALQDQTFGLKTIRYDDPTQGDRSLARLSLIEGDASLLMSLWASRHLTSDELIELLRQSNDPETAAVLARMPPIIVRQTLFPYTEGLKFVGALYEEGGWKRVDEAYRDLPDSTEQILHPELYLQRDKPVSVSLPSADEVGSGWEVRVSDTLGESVIRTWAEESLPSGQANDAAAGWDGDRIALEEGPGGAWIVAWVSEWDNEEDAVEFTTAAETIVDALAGDAAVIAGGPGTRRVIVLLAADEASLEKARSAFGQAP